MTRLDAALAYTRRGWPVFPCDWAGDRRKRPLTKHELHDASGDPTIVAGWWQRWPQALIGAPTGAASLFVVLDVDVKRDRENGYDTLDDLGFSIFPATPMVHTPSSGLHLYFALPAGVEIRNTEGAKGRGVSTDVQNWTLFDTESWTPWLSLYCPVLDAGVACPGSA
jgi:hypothetical protein